MELVFGLSVVDQMNGGREAKKLAEGRMDRGSGSGTRLRARVGAALIAVGTRLVPRADAADGRETGASTVGPRLASRT